MRWPNRFTSKLIPTISFFFFFTGICLGTQGPRAALPADSDGDGMPDRWEIRMGTDPETNDAAGDPDHDGLTNLQEYQNGSNPFSSDSDEDGIDDGDEVHQYGTSPAVFDTDRGGRPDGEELLSGKNPLDPDDDTQKGETDSITLQLTSQWNLISIPFFPGTADIGRIIGPIADVCEKVWTYKNGTWQAYLPSQPDFSDLATLVPGQGYWLLMKDARGFPLSGSATSASIQLATGWNLAGYNAAQPQSIESALSSIAGKYISVWSYEEGRWKVYTPDQPDFSDLTVMKPGFGYWIKTTVSCTWDLP